MDNLSVVPTEFFGIALVFLGLVGLTLGSFSTVLVDRLPHGLSIRGRSHCPHCKKALKIMDLIPVLSCLFRRGLCRFCGEPIPLWYLLLEIGSVVVILVPALVVGAVTPVTVLHGLTLWLLFVIAVTDEHSQGVPDALSIPFIAFAAFAAHLQGSLNWIGPVLGGAFFGVQWVLSRGRWVGSGDILIGIGAGFLLRSWEMTILAIGMAYVIGALYGLMGLLRGSIARHSHIAFIPFFATGIFVTFALGEFLWDFFF